MPVNANANQEETGRHRYSEESEYDIFCPLFGGPKYKLNYTSGSCEQRRTQRLNRCTQSDCKRYKGKPVAVKVAKPRVETKKQGRPKRKIVVGNCLDCGERHKLNSRLLCTTCYKYHAHRGTYQQFPKVA